LNAMAELLASTPGYKRRILAAGEMLELGSSSAQLHRECGREVARMGGIDWIFGVRGYASDFVQAAVAAGHPPDRAQLFENSEEAGQFLKESITRGDLLLLKGSRGVKMEKILEAIETEHRRLNSRSSPEIFADSRKGRN
jgi:UDP-N-acetylmuramoyl-tripeptide--D-alanyl-D-alanine ligase